MKKLEKLETIIVTAITILGNIGFWLIEDEEGSSYWRPAFVCGHYDPDKADHILRRAQGKIFQLMKEAGKPLYGYLQLDALIRSIDKGNSLEAAYCVASKEQPQYKVTIESGSGTQEDPFVLL